MDNIIHTADGRTIIMNGGNPLKGCPESWDEARQWEEKANSHLDLEEDYYDWRKDISHIRSKSPIWTFDCGFKLDYDGALMRVSSRFYPPKTHYGATWDGTVTVYLAGYQVAERKFDCETLEQLKSEVESYIGSITESVSESLKNIKL